MAGTDAEVTFTLTGSEGSASVTVDAGAGRMERNETNFVTFQSPDLGKLQAISVQRDNSGIGPDWHLDSIRVESSRYGINTRADFNRWIDSTTPFAQAL
jgi:hypothetical protein